MQPSTPTTAVQMPIHYAVKTTTSGLLSRSNSSPHTVDPVKHHYVPPSPTRKRHGHSHSVESVNGIYNVSEGQYPSPLPVPPTFCVNAGSPTRSTFATPQRKRADTLPSGSTNPCVSVANDATLTDNSLPSEPKQWTTDQLITYLSTSLGSNGDLGVPNTDGVLDWVRECGLTGREWLRLTDRHLAGTSLSDAQISLVLDSSRTLRADSLRRRIWMDSSDAVNATSSSPFHGALYRNSISSTDLSTPSPNTTVDTEIPISPPLTLHRSNSVSESFMRRYRDLAHIRVRRRGKVKGLVETWEGEVNRRGSLSNTEGSICSEGSVSGSDAGSESEVSEEHDVGQAFPEEALSTNGSGSPTPSMADTTLIALNPPPPYTSINALDEEEPSIEDLLASSGSLEGARAWEADLRLGETVKRIPTAGPAYPAMGEEKVDSIREAGLEENNDRGGSECPDVTIDPADEGPQNTVPNAISTVCVGVQVGDALSLANRSPSEWADQTDAICAIEASLVSTRAELETFKARLEVLEADLLHSEETSLQPSDEANGNLLQNEETLRKKDAQVSTDDGQLLQQTQDETAPYTELDWRGIVRSVSTGILTWLYPYTQPIRHRDAMNCPKRRKDSLSPVRATALPAMRLSSIITFSFLLCAALLRRAGLTRWIRKP
ncbi:hypothetical protein F5J12DRAFT_862029 [Pisolithus orientalis]|uniref:uncharacterized protein n=1 Tax=Pisolithus orientalis TaxID=936130 RepID=UPI0022243508|nr:uncharacterized protein F5J12DRAFT_862029 [Pisolithus orientalis]KAI5991101.1 hypothetical protein F5J12DRAFT_862029 [Pisolithus orientalis]